MDILEIVFWVLLTVFAFFYLAYLGIVSFAAKKSNNVKKQQVLPRVSLIIPTYNEKDTILQKLSNVKNLNYPREKLEVILIDSGSADKTVEIARSYHENNVDLNLQLVVEKERKGKANALNQAFPLCTGEIVVISDADSLIEKDSLLQLVSNFADSNIGAATGRQILLNAGQSVATNIEKGYRDIFEVIRTGESHIDSTPIFHGELSAFRRNLIEKIASDSIADDTELAIRIRKKGYRTIYDSNAKFYEYAPPTLKARIKQKQRRGMGLIQQFFRFRNLMFNRAYGKYGLLILPSEFFMHVVSPLLGVIFAILFLLVVITNPFYMMFMVVSFSAALILILGILAAVKLVSPSKRIPNPFAVMLAFLHSQICLLLAFFLLITNKKSQQWEKIEDIRSLWKASS